MEGTIRGDAVIHAKVLASGFQSATRRTLHSLQILIWISGFRFFALTLET